MVDVKSKTKERLTVQEFGDLSVDCIWSAHANSIFAFFLGGGGVHLLLHSVKRIVYIRPEVKFLTSVAGAICTGIYTAKVLRENCDRRIEAKYDTVNLIR